MKLSEKQAEQMLAASWVCRSASEEHRLIKTALFSVFIGFIHRVCLFWRGGDLCLKVFCVSRGNPQGITVGAVHHESHRVIMCVLPHWCSTLTHRAGNQQSCSLQTWNSKRYIYLFYRIYYILNIAILFLTFCNLCIDTFCKSEMILQLFGSLFFSSPLKCFWLSKSKG